MSDEIENIHDKLSDYSYALDFQKQLNDLSTDNVKYTTSIAKDTAFCIEALQLEITILKQIVLILLFKRKLGILGLPNFRIEIPTLL